LRKGEKVSLDNNKSPQDDQEALLDKHLAIAVANTKKFEVIANLISTIAIWVGRVAIAWIITSGAVSILTQDTENLSLVQKIIESFAQLINARFSFLFILLLMALFVIYILYKQNRRHIAKIDKYRKIVEKDDPERSSSAKD